MKDRLTFWATVDSLFMIAVFALGILALLTRDQGVVLAFAIMAVFSAITTLTVIENLLVQIAKNQVEAARRSSR